MSVKKKSEDNQVEILVVEDSPTQAEQLKYILETEGYQVTVARNGEEALSLMNKRRPTLVISDIIMPEMDGYQLCRQIRADKDLRSLPVILLTGLSDSSDVVKALECGADNFLTKPYEETYLLSRLRYFLINQELRRTDSIHMGLEIFFQDQKFLINSDRMQILNLLLSTYEAAVQKNSELTKVQEELRNLNEQLEDKVKERTAELEAEIVERKRAESESQCLAKFPSENPNPVLRISRDGTLLYINEAGLTQLPEWHLQVGQAVPALLQEIVFQSLDNGLARVFDLDHCGRAFSFTVTPIVGAAYLNLYGLDITERKRVNEVLTETLADLKRSNKDLEQFAYVASHDLQEPLRMVASYTQLIARRYEGRLDTDANEFIGFAVDGARRMQKMIDDLLSYSRVGTRPKPFETVDWTALLGQVVTNLKMAIEETGAVITHDPLPMVRGDDSQLILLFQNLIGNAIKFRGEKAPRIHISATRESRKTRCDGQYTIDPVQTQLREFEEGWVFSVKDNGIGIDPQYNERIFLTFTRLHGKEEYPGTGIGLALCKKIVEHHNGRIWVESEPEKGSMFYFTLPETGGLKC